MKRLLLLITICISTVSFGQTNNYSVDFDGVDDYVNITTASEFDALNTQLTVSAWINPIATSSGASPRIVDRSEGNGGGVDRWLLSWTPSGDNLVMSFAVGASNTETVYGSTSVNLNEWTHVAAIFDNGSVSIFINGSLDGSQTISFSDIMHVQGVDINIGSVNGDNSFFPGNIDDVHIWNVALTEQEIQDYMNCPPTGNETGLLGYWNFEEGTGTTAGDLTSNGNDGTLTNGPTWSTDVPAYNCNVGISELNSNQPKELIKIVNLLGQEVEYTPNTVLIYQYSDGTSEKVFTIED